MTAGPWFRVRKSNAAETRPGRRVFARRAYAAAAIMLASAPSVLAEPPVASYIFPAGRAAGRRRPFKVGGLYLNDACSLDLQGPGVAASKRVTRTKTVWFEGPPMRAAGLEPGRVVPAGLRGNGPGRRNSTPGDAVLARFDFAGYHCTKKVGGRLISRKFRGRNRRRSDSDGRQPTRDHQWTDFSA